MRAKCQGENIVMCVESLLTQIYLCRDCRETFIVDKPRGARTSEGKNKAPIDRPYPPKKIHAVHMMGE